MKLAATALFAAAALAAGPAAAQTRTLATAGAWRVYGGASNDGTPLCGMSTIDRATSRELHVKYFRGSPHLAVQMFKASWRIPREAQVDVVTQVDAAPPLSASAVSVAEANGRGLQWNVGLDLLADFLARFSGGSRMTVSFPSGSEPPWVANLQGTASVIQAFSQCVSEVRGGAGPGGTTQPFGGVRSPGGATQPFGGAPSQPFGGGPRSPAPSGGAMPKD